MATKNSFNYGTGAVSTFMTGNGVGNVPTFQTGGTSTAGKSSFLAFPSVDQNWDPLGPSIFKILFDTEVYDTNGDYNAGTSVYTVPTSGKVYLVSAFLSCFATDGPNGVHRNINPIVYINGSPVAKRSVLTYKIPANNQTSSIIWQGILSAGDTIEIYMEGGVIALSGGDIRSGQPLLTYFMVNQMS